MNKRFECIELDKNDHRHIDRFADVCRIVLFPIYIIAKLIDKLRR